MRSVLIIAGPDQKIETKTRMNSKISSWFRFKTQKSNLNIEQEKLLGVTDELINFIKSSITLETFKNSPLKGDEEGASDFDDDSPSSSRKDLSDWQEKHAILVLAKSKEISQLRYKLCPRHFTDRQFWRIYFLLVKSYVFEYELDAIRLAKVKRMATETESSSYKSGYEVEMAETKQATSASPPTLTEDYPESFSSKNHNGVAGMSSTGASSAKVGEISAGT